MQVRQQSDQPRPGARQWSRSCGTYVQNLTVRPSDDRRGPAVSSPLGGTTARPAGQPPRQSPHPSPAVTSTSDRTGQVSAPTRATIGAGRPGAPTRSTRSPAPRGSPHRTPCAARYLNRRIAEPVSNTAGSMAGPPAAATEFSRDRGELRELCLELPGPLLGQRLGLRVAALRRLGTGQLLRRGQVAVHVLQPVHVERRTRSATGVVQVGGCHHAGHLTGDRLRRRLVPLGQPAGHRGHRRAGAAGDIRGQRMDLVFVLPLAARPAIVTACCRNCTRLSRNVTSAALCWLPAELGAGWGRRGRRRRTKTGCCRPRGGATARRSRSRPDRAQRH